MMRRHYPGRSWVALQEDTVERLTRLPPRARAALLRRLRRAHARRATRRRRPVSDERRTRLRGARSARCCGRATRSTRTRAARPRTRRPRRSASSIPPAYAATNAGAPRQPHAARPRARGPGAPLGAEVRFLQSSGSRHEAAERRVAFDAVPARRARAPRRGQQTFAEDGLRRRRAPLGRGARRRALRGRAACREHDARSRRVDAEPRARRSRRACSRRCRSCGSAPGASPRRSDPTVGARAARTRSRCSRRRPTTRCSAPRSCFPEHPQIAPESRGDLFDGTEIEEALLLHVLALSDDERASIERDDPAVRAMIERAAAATPAEILALHGRMTLSDPPRPGGAP